MKGNFKDFVRNKKATICGLTAMASTALMSVPVFASVEGSTFNGAEALQAGLQGASNEYLKYVAIVVPIAIGLMIAPFALRKGIALFKSLASK